MSERTAERDAAVAERVSTEQALTSAKSEAETYRGHAAAAVGKYREAIVSGSADLAGVADLIVGDSIEALDAAAERARGIVGRVREQVEAAQAARPVPAGGTTRQGVDTSGMSAAELLRFGVSQKIGAA